MTLVTVKEGDRLNTYFVPDEDVLIIREYESYTIAEDLLLDGELQIDTLGALGVL